MRGSGMRVSLVALLPLLLLLLLLLVVVIVLLLGRRGRREKAAGRSGKASAAGSTLPFTLWCEYPQTKRFDEYTSALLAFVKEFPVKRLVVRVQNPKVFSVFQRQGLFFTTLMPGLDASVEEVYILPWLGDPWDADANGYGFGESELSAECRQIIAQGAPSPEQVPSLAVCWLSAAHALDPRIRGFLFEKEGVPKTITNQTIHDALKARFGSLFVDDLSSVIRFGTTDYNLGPAPYVHKIFPELYNLCGSTCAVVDATSDPALVCGGGKTQPQFPDTIYTQAQASQDPAAFLEEKFAGLAKRCGVGLGQEECAARVVPLFSVEIGPDPFPCGSDPSIPNPYRPKDFVTVTGNDGRLGTINAFGTFRDAQPALLAMQGVAQSLGYAEFGVFQFDLIPATWQERQERG